MLVRVSVLFVGATMRPPVICFYEAFTEEAEALRRHLPADVPARFTGQTIQEAGDPEPPAPIVSMRTQSQIPDAWADRLDAIITRSTGYDHVVAYRRRVGHCLPAGYLPLYCHRAVAEQAALLWLALLRTLPAQLRQFRRFGRDGLTGRECAGRILAVVGVGNIGHEVVRIGRGLDMTVRGVDVVERHADVSYVAADLAIPAADVIVCAMNLTDDNVGYFDYARLAGVRPGAVFINIARGKMSPPADLRRLLDERRLGGVGLDVYDQEQALAVALRQGSTPAPGDPAAESIRETLRLAEHPNVLATPHNAFNTVEAVDRKARQTVETLVAFLRDGTIPFPVPD